MPSENEVFGAAGAHSDSAAGGSASGAAQGGASMLGDGGGDDNGGADLLAGRGGGASNSGTSGAAGVSGASVGSSGSTGASAFDPEAGLVAYFTFDEPSGAVAANAKDSSKNAKCVGTCTRPVGQLGQAFGIRNDVSPSDWIELPAGIFSGYSSITLSVWLRDRSTSRTGAPLFHFSSGAKEAISLIPDDRNAKTSAEGAHLSGLHAGTSFVELWSPKPNLTDKDWHQVVFSWSAASIDLYIDGKPVGTDPSPTVLPSQLGTTSPNYLGRAPDDTSLAFYGEIDDLRIYDRVLSAAQVAQLYKVR
ncbi:MAG: LamG domain-containing protein [Pseudomonadota bacterium]